MSTQSVLEYASRKFGGVPQLPPVVGGSGRRYWTIAAALAGESAQAVTVAGVVPQAGTQAGVIVFQAGQSAVNNFYQNQYVLDTDTTPTNGLVAQWARISDYVGATRTATLDKPWDFSAESSVDIIQPARIALEEDVTEDVTVTIPVEIDLQGHKIVGKVDVTAGQFCWIRGGSGFVTNGVQKTDFGLLKIDDCTVSRRDATIYALLLTEANNLGRCELNNVTIQGAYAARRGFMGWSVYNCKQMGLADGVDNTPARLVESLAGIAVVMSALDVALTGEFAGSVVYTENSITGTAYMSVQADIYLPKFPTGSTLFTTTRPYFSVWKCVAAGVINVTLVTTTASAIDVSVGTNFSDTTTTQQLAVCYLTVRQMTGSVTIVQTGVQINFTVTAGQDVTSVVALIEVHGAANTTGNITMTSGQFRASAPHAIIATYRLASTYTGTATCSTTHVLRSYTALVEVIRFSVSQATGTPSITCSGQHIVEGASQWTMADYDAAAVSISVGTYIASGAVNASCVSPTSLMSISSIVSGGTWTLSGGINYGFSSRASTAGMVVLIHNGSGGTASVTSTTVTIAGGLAGVLNVLNTVSGGPAAAVSSNVLVVNCRFSAAVEIVAADVASASTANFTGTFTARYCSFDSTFTIAVSGNTDTITGPTSTLIEFCDFLSTFLDRGGVGSYTWSGATLKFKSCHIEGLVTLTATSFTTIEAYHTRFNGASGNKSIVVTGTRPTTFRYWACSFAQRYDDILPEVINVYDVLPAQAALVRGQPVFVNGANQYQVCVAGSVVDGVLLAAAGGAGTFAVCVRQGRVFVAVNAGVVNGSNLVLDVVTPTQANTGAAVIAQQIGTALEAAGATVAGKAYAAVNVR